MAEVDFSHARIEPFTGTVGTMPTYNPTARQYLALNNNAIFKIENNNYVQIGSCTFTQVVNEQKQMMYQYQGTFTDSGTLFHLIWDDNHAYMTGWTISNISFSSGDTFIFKIRADLICQ